MSVKVTPLNALHKFLKARMAPFAGYDMPIQYANGILKEHLHTRTLAGLFDVSHMGQVKFHGGDREKFLEWVTPADVQVLKNGQARLSMITNDKGGVRDDCIISRYPNYAFVVVNAGCKDKDYDHFRSKMTEFKGDVTMEVLEDRALVALQGPEAKTVLSKYVDGLSTLPFMSAIEATHIQGIPVRVTRCGYTGEDGFEISSEAKDAEKLVDVFLKNHGTQVQMIGLGARDSLRLEAGMCLYGHELDETINPVAAKLMWCITSRRMTEGGFIGHSAVVNFKTNAQTLVPQLRVGVLSTGPVARETMLVQAPQSGKVIGKVSSGCPSPSLKKNIAMAYVDREFAKVGTKVSLMVRNSEVEGEVVNVPFVATRYAK